MKEIYPFELEKIEKELFENYLKYIKSKNKLYYLQNEIVNHYNDFSQNIDKRHKKYLYKFLLKLQELIINNNSFIAVYRYKIAKHKIFNINISPFSIKEIGIKDYINIRDFIVTGQKNPENLVNIDLLPFYDYSPSIKNSEDIGNGIQFLNKILSSNLFQNPDKCEAQLFKFLSIHSLGKKQLLINNKKIQSSSKLKDLLEYMIDYIKEHQDSPKEEIIKEMQKLGFEAGWGNTPEKIRKSMKLLINLFHAPDSEHLEKFIALIPMISKIAIISPHGWFGQKNVLGRPDTGGQIVYILDQVKYLEKSLKQSLIDSGLKVKPKILIITRLIPNNEGTTSNIEKEKVENTDNCFILRIPFKNKEGEILQNWISRFNIWNYLEQYSIDVRDKLLQEMKGKPDLIIGNYSDGNLVATFLSQKLKVTQFNIAHALEKSKYIFSDLYWYKMENEYKFSQQFTADLISMNMASCIITSTFQEIAGTEYTRGQYESFQFYSLPNLYRVKSGINLFHPKFNIIPPGIMEDIYYPYYKTTKKHLPTRKRVKKLIFSEDPNFIIGSFSKPEKPIIYAVARLDKIKNLTGLAEAYAKNKELQEYANLVIVGGQVKVELAQDAEQKQEIYKMYDIINKYNISGKFKWVAKSFKRVDNAAMYRVIAETGGCFVQPALFEAFGLTVIEAMGSGLPTFATQFGGPSEIIQDGINGFLINPTLQEEMTKKILDFFKKCNDNPNYWEEISESGIERVKTAYNWNLYASKLLNLAKIHGFWKYSVSTGAKEKMKLYCSLIYDDFCRKRLI